MPRQKQAAAAPVPVVIITGFLGAGKTSFLNHLLGLPSIRNLDTALIINEFGTRGVDGQLVRPGSYRRFDLNRGSLFCICIKTEFLATLSAIAAGKQPDIVIIEATGLADPCDIEVFLDAPNLAGRFRMKAGVCIVDAVNFTRVVPFMKAAANQVAWADALVITKSDLVPASDVTRLHGVLAGINPRAPRTVAEHGAVPPSFVDNLAHEQRAAQPTTQAPRSIVSATIDMTGPVVLDRLERLMRSLGNACLRAKGIVDTVNGPRLVEMVFDRYSDQAVPPTTGPERHLTIIAQGITRDEILAHFGSL